MKSFKTFVSEQPNSGESQQFIERVADKAVGALRDSRDALIELNGSITSIVEEFLQRLGTGMSEYKKEDFGKLVIKLKTNPNYWIPLSIGTTLLVAYGIYRYTMWRASQQATQDKKEIKKYALKTTVKALQDAKQAAIRSRKEKKKAAITREMNKYIARIEKLE